MIITLRYYPHIQQIKPLNFCRTKQLSKVLETSVNQTCYCLLQNSGEPIKWPFEIPQPTVLGRVQVIQEHFVLAWPSVGQDPGGTCHQLSPVQIPCYWSLHLPRSQ